MSFEKLIYIFRETTNFREMLYYILKVHWFQVFVWIVPVENCFAIYPKDSKSLMIWKKFQIFGLSIFPDFFCCFYWISRASAYLQAMKVRFTCQNVIFVHISNFSKTEVSAAKVLFFIRTKVFTYNNYYLSIIKVAHNCHTINLYSLRVCITFYGS